MKILKVGLGLVAAVIVVVAIVVVVGLQNINQIVKVAIEDVGSDVLGTQVQLQSANIELTNGRGELNSLRIANPKGYSKNSAFELGNIIVQVDTSSLTSDVIVIKEIAISGAKLLAEQKGLTETNLQALLDNVNSGSSESATSEAKSSEASAGEATAEILLAIEKFTFSDSDLKVVTQEWGDLDLQLPTVSLKNIGTKDKGLTPEQLAEAMIKPVLAAAQKSVKNNLKSLAKDKLEAKAKERLEEKLGSEKAEQLNQLKSLFGK